MITLLQQTGYDALQGLGVGEKLRFTSFKVASGDAVEPSATYTGPQGTLVYTGGPTDMRFVPWHNEGYILQLFIGSDKPEMAITNVMLYVDDEIPFCFCMSKTYFLKLTTTNDTVGMRWMLQIEIRIPNLLDKFSFDNLSTNLADIIRVADVAELDSTYLPLNNRDQGILLNYEPLGRAVPLLYIGGELYGNPLLFASDDIGGFRFDGGEDGDNYQYAYDPNENWLLHEGVWNDDLRWRDSAAWED